MVLIFFLNKCEKSCHNINDYLALFNLSGKFKLRRNLIDKGLRGVFFNNDRPEIIVKGIQTILAGDLWFSRNIMQNFLLDDSNQNELSEKPLLTFREKEMSVTCLR